MCTRWIVKVRQSDALSGKTSPAQLWYNDEVVFSAVLKAERRIAVSYFRGARSWQKAWKRDVHLLRNST